VKTAIVDRNPETAGSLATRLTEKYNTPCIGIEADVLEKDTLLKARDIIHEKLGDIDFLINAAGGNSPDATQGWNSCRT